MESRTGWVAAGLLTMFAAEAQVSEVGSGTAEEYRYPQDGPVPDEVAMRVLLQLAKSAPIAVRQKLETAAGLETNAANDAVAVLGELHDLWSKETAAAIDATRCSVHRDRSRLDDHEAHEILDLVDEIRDTIDRKYMVLAHASLGREAVAKVMTSFKPTIAGQRIRARSAFANEPPHAAVIRLIEVCRNDQIAPHGRPNEW